MFLLNCVLSLYFCHTLLAEEFQMALDPDSVGSQIVTDDVLGIPRGTGQSSDPHVDFWYMDCREKNQVLSKFVAERRTDSDGYAYSYDCQDLYKFQLTDREFVGDFLPSGYSYRWNSGPEEELRYYCPFGSLISAMYSKVHIEKKDRRFRVYCRQLSESWQMQKLHKFVSEHLDDDFDYPHYPVDFKLSAPMGNKLAANFLLEDTDFLVGIKSEFNKPTAQRTFTFITVPIAEVFPSYETWGNITQENTDTSKDKRKWNFGRQ